MKIATLYSIGDRVYGLTTYREHRRRICEVCDGTGSVRVAGHETLTTYCPAAACRAGEVSEQTETLFASVRPLTIGAIRVDVDRGSGSHEIKVRYMAEQTGVGSGRLWPAGDVYATTEQALTAAEHAGAVDDGGARLRAEKRTRWW